VDPMKTLLGPLKNPRDSPNLSFAPHFLSDQEMIPDNQEMIPDNQESE
jgi:hypothetical protein